MALQAIFLIRSRYFRLFTIRLCIRNISKIKTQILNLNLNYNRLQTTNQSSRELFFEENNNIQTNLCCQARF